MRKTLHKRILTLQEINRRAVQDPKGFVEEEEHRYATEVTELSKLLVEDMDDRCLIMLAGPSSSGKTTTAGMLCSELQRNGVDAHVISLDDFYRGRRQAPQLADGSYDYEALEALNLEQLRCCMKELLQDGISQIPVFDFLTGSPAEQKRELRIGHNSAVIFEGIHALNPIFEQHLPQENLYKVFINTMTAIYDGEMKLLARRQLRLVRRLLRDARFRNSPPDNTLQMWQQVVRGENLYMFPYVDTVDYAIDTTHAYEPCVFTKELLSLLGELPKNDPFIATAEQLQSAIHQFEPLPTSLVTCHSMLREFIGNDDCD